MEIRVELNKKPISLCHIHQSHPLNNDRVDEPTLLFVSILSKKKNYFSFQEHMQYRCEIICYLFQYLMYKNFFNDNVHICITFV